MSSFEELMKQPLKSTLINESADDLNDLDVPVVTPEEEPEVSDIPDHEETPEEEVPDVDNSEDVVDELPPEEDSAVDDTMNAVATPILLNDASEEEIREFTESEECMIAEAEGLLTERTIVRFDKNAKRAQLYEVAVAACAREHKDPLYKKLETAYKIERTLKAKLRRKYDAPARRKVKDYLARAKKSKSGILSRIASKIKGN